MSHNSLPGTLIFDLDGTLVDTWQLYMEAYRRALAPLLEEIPREEEIVARRPTSERHFLAEWVGAEAADRCHAAMVEHYVALHDTHCEGLYEGTREMLDALAAGGMRLGIVTGKGRRAWQATARSLDLDRFEVVVTEDDVARPKPHPEGLHTALRAMGADPGDAVYIGDSRGDMEAGRNAGTRVGAVLWPKTAPGEREAFLAEIAPLKPDWTFDLPADLTRTFAGWCGLG